LVDTKIYIKKVVTNMASILDFLYEKEQEKKPTALQSMLLMDAPVSREPASVAPVVQPKPASGPLTKKAPADRVLSAASNDTAADQALKTAQALGFEDQSSEDDDTKTILQQMRDRMNKARSIASDSKNEQLDNLAASIVFKKPEIAKLTKAVSEDEVLKDPQNSLLAYSKLREAGKGKRDALVKDIYAQQLNAKAADRMAGQMKSERDILRGLEYDTKLQDTLEKTTAKLASSFSDEKNKLATIKEGLLSGDYQKFSNQLSNFSRYVSGQKGVLTDKDITLVVPGSILTGMAQVEAYFNKTPTAKLPPEFTKGLVELTELAEKKSLAKAKEDFKQRKVGWTAPRSGYQRILGEGGPGQAALDNLEDILAEQDSIINKPKKSGLSSEKEARRQELLKKLGK